MKYSVFICLALIGAGILAWSPFFSRPSPRRSTYAQSTEFDPGPGVAISNHLEKRAKGINASLRKKLVKTIVDESNAAKFDPLFVLAVMEVESSYREDAVSNRGARGLMQLTRQTLQYWSQKQGLRLSVEEIENDPTLNVTLGIRYLAALRESFLGDMDLALMSYNAGSGKIVEARREGGLERFQVYVKSVKSRYMLLQKRTALENERAMASRANSATIRPQ